tara:strand:+ start:5155 stop:6651 length:1497 start_codon:yes stop_codon:yes gene_type:complete
MQEVNILWFKKDLRLVDNEALLESSKEFRILPIYVVEKDLWKQKSHSDRQWQFCKECLKDLQKDLEYLGQPLIIRTGNVVEAFEQIKKDFEIKGIYSHQETGDLYTFQRDKEVKEWAQKNNIIWKEYLQFGVFRGTIDRNHWGELWKSHINKEIINKDFKFQPLEINSEKIPSDTYFKFNYDPCLGRLKGGRKEGLKRLKLFLNSKISSYSKDISNPQKSYFSCSRLSPYITWGCISLREIFSEVNKLKDNNSQMFKSRLFWHCHFIQKLESEPELEFREFHPYFSNLRESNNYLIELWSTGKTGFPFIDACMRSLNHNGWINFRMRAMLMSFASYNLWLPWQETGMKLAQKFVDYEPGIHWCQCQMQSGTTSININRIYNPIKQGKDHDPDGIFIKKWVPELREISKTFIHEPWLINSQEDYEIIKYTNYISPIVDIKKSSDLARKVLYEISLKNGFKDISKKVYEKHGSRKKSSLKRKRIKNRRNYLKQFELDLNL